MRVWTIGVHEGAERERERTRESVRESLNWKRELELEEGCTEGREKIRSVCGVISREVGLLVVMHTWKASGTYQTRRRKRSR